MPRTASTPVPIGAVVRALGELGFETPETCATLLAALGWARAIAEAPAPPPAFLPPSLRPEVRKPAPPPEPPSERRRALPSTLTTLSARTPEEPDWLARSEPLPLPDPTRAVPVYAKPIEPLLPPQITRAILTRLASAPAPVGEVDVPRLVETVATGRPLTALPRRSAPTLAKGLELLIDHGRGMTPFANDVAGLIDDLAVAVGRDRLTVRLFRDTPYAGLIDAETAALAPYTPPAIGTPVLVVTDFGVAERRARSAPVPIAAWFEFAAVLRSRGNPLAILMPGAPARLPAALRRALKPVVWDRRTGARLTDRAHAAATPQPANSAEQLARLASIAGRIDPQLLRALRLVLAPEVGVEAEADLWVSDLVQKAAVTGLVLRPEHQRRLQDELAAADGDLLTRAWEVLYRLRTDRPWSERERVGDCSWLVAQEELTYRALRGLADEGPERSAVEQRITQILKTLVSAAGTERERDAVAWARTARSRLPESVMRLERMRHLLIGAARRGADTLPPAEVAEAVGDPATAYLTPRHQEATLPLWVRLVDGGLEAALQPLSEAHAITVPRVQPLPLALAWDDEASTPQRGHLQLDPPRHAFVALAADQVAIIAPDGSRFSLSRSRRSLLINVPPPPAIFVDREAEMRAALDALLAAPADVGSEAASGPLRVFVSYTQGDDLARDDLAKVLRLLEKQDLIKVLENRVVPGEVWGEGMPNALLEADVFLLLVSPDYLASGWNRQEMDIALSRSAERSALVVPIIVRQCDWEKIPLGELRILPEDGRPLMADEDIANRALAWTNLAVDLEQALRTHQRSLDVRHQAAPTPRVVALGGPDGIGKFTLARRLVHLPEVQARYPDGILWLGEDGSGYPRKWLRDYCATKNEAAPFGDNDNVDEERFRELFAGRRVLFVADRAAASDILPTLRRDAGSACVVLMLTVRPPSDPDEWVNPVIIDPFSVNAQVEAATAFGMAEDAPRDLIEFAGGNPLFLRLASAPAAPGDLDFRTRAALTWALELAPERAYNRKQPLLESALEHLDEHGRAASLLFALGIHKTTPGTQKAETSAVADESRLDARQRLALRRLIVTGGYATRFPCDEVAGGAADLDGVIRLGLVEDLGSEVRLHPLLRSIIPEIDPETAEIQSMFWELERADTPHRRRAEIGDRLDALGDPRRGVGVEADGTPDIAWCSVPGGEVTIEDGKRTTRRVEPFLIARYPVTVAQYRAFLDASDGWRDAAWWTDDLHRDPHGLGADIGSNGNNPAIRVSWFDAVAFCRWLGRHLRLDVRLPDEFEWQQAATGGDNTNVYPWGWNWNPEVEPWRANTSESRLDHATAVGMYPAGASPLGALDLAGTVEEWCLNKYDEPQVTQSRPSDRVPRVLRGCSWGGSQHGARAASRSGGGPAAGTTTSVFVWCVRPHLPGADH